MFENRTQASVLDTTSSLRAIVSVFFLHSLVTVGWRLISPRHRRVLHYERKFWAYHRTYQLLPRFLYTQCDQRQRWWFFRLAGIHLACYSFLGPKCLRYIEMYSVRRCQYRSRWRGRDNVYLLYLYTGGRYSVPISTFAYWLSWAKNIAHELVVYMVTSPTKLILIRRPTNLLLIRKHHVFRFRYGIKPESKMYHTNRNRASSESASRSPIQMSQYNFSAGGGNNAL